jgi:hypothetical protein
VTKKVVGVFVRFRGDLSAILIENMPIWAEFSSTPSNKISLMSEWETKLRYQRN